MDQVAYLDQLRSLLPPGAALEAPPGSTLAAILAPIAAELARADGRAAAALTEADPRLASETLVDWERAFGLPDECAGAGDTVTARRAALLARITGLGGQSRAYFIGVAAALGFEITITEFQPFRVGRGRAGEEILGEPWAFAWRVEAAEETVRVFRVGPWSAGEPLADWGNAPLECTLNRLKPAHTVLIFAYGT